MILPDLFLTSRAKQVLDYSGIDSIDYCADKKHFITYPYTVQYIYNSRGFRDIEWPSSDSELKSAIWCIGDSFTVGIGSPLSHSWTSCLSKLSNRRIINVSMDGASNEWITRIAQSIVDQINPEHMVIMWSYTHRRELNDITLSDEDRRVYATKSSVMEDLDNLLECKKKIDSKIKCIQFIIPGALPDVNAYWKPIADSSQGVCLDNIDRCLSIQNLLNFLPVVQQDWARDGYHFDLITADWVAMQALDLLRQQASSKIYAQTE